MTEQAIQTKKIKELEAKGYYVIKLIRTNKNGIPDLVAIPPNSDAIFIEVKRPGKDTTPLQKFRAKELESMGVKVEVYKGE